MLTDPQSITVNSVAKSMPRVLNEGQHALYQMPDSTFSLDVKHVSSKRDKKTRVKSLATFTQRAVVPDPLTSINDYETVAVSIMIDRPEAGFTSTQIDQMVVGFKTWLDSTMVGKLFGKES
jgi:hypothetical protein